MKIKVNGPELGRMMKIISQCIDSRTQSDRANIEICHEDNQLSIRGVSSQWSATMHTPVLGGDGEKFCVDGGMFAKIAAMCGKETLIDATGKTCVVKCNGKATLPVVDANIPEPGDVTGKQVRMSADAFAKGLGGVLYAVAVDQTRPVLTGILLEASGGRMKMVALDGFQLGIEEVPCEGDELRAIVPSGFLKLVSQAACGEEITLSTDKQRIKAQTDSMVMMCGLISGEYVDYERILPKNYSTECMVQVDALRNALRSCSVINSKQNLVKLEITDGGIVVRNNSEEAAYEAEIPCDVRGNGLKIAFNLKYLTSAVGAVSAEKAVIKMTSPVSPCVIQGKDESGIRLLLPVRVNE